MLQLLSTPRGSDFVVMPPPISEVAQKEGNQEENEPEMNNYRKKPQFRRHCAGT